MRRAGRVALPRSAIEEDLVGFLRQWRPANARLLPMTKDHAAHRLVAPGVRAARPFRLVREESRQ